MKKTFLFLLALTLFAGCAKEDLGPIINAQVISKCGPPINGGIDGAYNYYSVSASSSIGLQELNIFVDNIGWAHLVLNGTKNSQPTEICTMEGVIEISVTDTKGHTTSSYLK